MLLNLSNHSSEKWKAQQKQAALSKYQQILDWPFPQIHPAFDKKAVSKMVTIYKKKILELGPSAVHIMGEMTFTYALVRRLKRAGIPCIASTTERNVVENQGKKITTFLFVRFRAY